MYKLLVKILLFCFIIINYHDCYSQIDAIQYYPLKEGNVWVYWFLSSFGSNFKFKRTASSIVISNNHKYYNIDNSYLRVDSNNGNVYNLQIGNGCPWSIHERMTDSLAAKISDTAMRNCGADRNICIDTNIRTIFGLSVRTKHFRYHNAGNSGNIYARNFGIISGYGGTSPNLWGITLVGCVIDGVVYGDTSTLVGINQIGSEVPQQFSLLQNYPNPFNPTTNIEFQIPNSGYVKLVVYNMLGKEVQKLVNQELVAGTYEVDFDGSNLPSGVYYYRLEVDSYTETKKMLIVK